MPSTWASTGPNVLTLEVEPLDQSAPIRRDYYAALTAALRQQPEVVAVGAIDQLGLTGGGSYGFPKADTGESVEGPQRTVLPGYFDAIGVRPLAGRLMEDADRLVGEAVVVNGNASDKYFGGNAIGHTLQSGGPRSRHWRIVGVVPNIRHGGPQGRVGPEMYILPNPAATETSDALAIVMLLRNEASLPVDRLKQIAEGLGPRVLVGKIRPAAALVSQQVTRPRNRMLLLTLLGAFGLMLSNSDCRLAIGNCRLADCRLRIAHCWIADC